MEKLKLIISEWFANLPKGYATQPYSSDEINLLRIIITEADNLNDAEKDALLKQTDKMSTPLNEQKTLKQLAQENKSTLPKIPTNKVFLNTVQQPILDDGYIALNKIINNNQESKLPLVKVPVDEIIPTQNNLTIPNLEKVKKLKNSKADPIILLKQSNKYFVIDGHHRIAIEILNGVSDIVVKVYDNSIKEAASVNGDELSKIEPDRNQKQDRFIAKSAPFIQSPAAFIEFIKTEYTNPGVEILGLEELFNAVIALDVDNFNSIVKLMAKHTNRQIDYGTFKMGQYELKLAELLHTHIKFEGASSLNLLLAIIFNGKVYSPPPNGLSKLAVEVSGVKLIKNESIDEYVMIQLMSSELNEIYRNIKTLNSILNDNESTDTMSLNDLTVLLTDLQNGSLNDELTNIIKQGSISKIPAIKILSGKLEQMLRGKSPSVIFDSFKELYNLEIEKFCQEYAKIFDVNIDKIEIKNSSDILKKVLIKNTISPNIQLDDSTIKVNSSLFQLGEREDNNNSEK